MRNMSFHLTTPQFKAHTKDVTRRCGWLFLLEMDLCIEKYLVQAVEKCQGIKKGELVKLNVIWLLNARAEPLHVITKHEVIREGFPNMSVDEFISFFCKTHNTKKKPCTPETIITRIEFKHYK
jgi:hypothetical protein